jgi:sterol desaturase/sphingolipid hydroxylase (fatty acid hydroxylase superfamily)
MELSLYSKLIPAAVLLILGILEALGGLYFSGKRSKTDYTIELVSLATLPTFIQPGIFLVTFFGMNFFLPNLENYFINLHFMWKVGTFLILDDMVQYWWHRWSHTNMTMWKLHRPHHVVEEMGVLVTYRNAILYYALMPGIWLSGILIYLGMGYVYIFYVTVKLIVILLAHSETKMGPFLIPL